MCMTNQKSVITREYIVLDQERDVVVAIVGLFLGSAYLRLASYYLVWQPLLRNTERAVEVSLRLWARTGRQHIA